MDKKQRAIDLKKISSVPDEILNHPDVNAYLLHEELHNNPKNSLTYEQFTKSTSKNEYLKLAKMMQNLKDREKAGDMAGPNEIKEAMLDFQKEQEDVLAVRDAGYLDGFLDQDVVSEKAKISMLRPPRTAREMLKTLKEADKRYEESKQALYGMDRPDLLEK